MDVDLGVTVAWRCASIDVDNVDDVMSLWWAWVVYKSHRCKLVFYDYSKDADDEIAFMVVVEDRIGFWPVIEVERGIVLGLGLEALELEEVMFLFAPLTPA